MRRRGRGQMVKAMDEELLIEEISHQEALLRIQRFLSRMAGLGHTEDPITQAVDWWIKSQFVCKFGPGGIITRAGTFTAIVSPPGI